MSSKQDLAAELKRLLLAAERRHDGRGRIKRAALARRIGVSPSSLYAYLDGTTLPPTGVLDRLLDVLDVPADDRRRLATARDDLEARRRPRGQREPVGDPPDPPDPAAARPVPRELPPDVYAFTGRDAELNLLDKLVSAGDRGTVAVAVIEGTAGVGKTALAVHWGHRAGGRFPDGQLYVNLRGYALTPPVRPIDALARMLRTLGTPADQIPADQDEAAANYRSKLAGKRVLILLDNAHGADQIRPLLAGGHGSLVLVTSRDQLGGLAAIDGAQQLHLDTLTRAESAELLGTLLGADRVGTEPAAAAELATLCGHLPLALRVAAANLAGPRPQRIAEFVTRLADSDRWSALAVAGDRQAAVSGAFDLSYTRLPEPARRLFRRLGVLPGPDVTAGTAAALLDTTLAEAEATLAMLAGAYLVELPATGRYGLHDLIRHYAADRAGREDDPADRQAAITRAYAYYLHCTRAAIRLLQPTMLTLPCPDELVVTGLAGPLTDAAGALAWLDAERPNLVAVVVHAAEHGPHQVAWLLADQLRGYLWLRTHLTDWLTVANAGQQAAVACGDPLAEAATELSLASLYLRRGRNAEATDHATRTLRLARLAGWLDGQAAALRGLGAAAMESGRLVEAAGHLNRALRLYRRARPSGTAAVLGDLCGTERDLGRLSQAVRHAKRALRLNRAAGSPSSAAGNLALLGGLHRQLGMPDRAIGYLTESLEIYRSTGHDGLESVTVCELAGVHRELGDLAQAMALAEQGLELARRSGHDGYVADAMVTVASIDNLAGRHRRAAGGYRRALELAETAGHRHLVVQALTGLAEASRHQDGERARQHLSSALDVARSAGYRVLEGQAGTVLAEVLLDAGDAVDAHDQAGQALAIHQETGYRYGEARTRLAMARILRGRDDRAAEEHRQLGEAVFAAIGSRSADQFV